MRGGAGRTGCPLRRRCHRSAVESSIRQTGAFDSCIEQLLEAMPDAVVVVDQIGRVVSVNRRADSLSD
jgi:PAS domain-containing protein